MKNIYSIIIVLAMGVFTVAQTSPITFSESWTVGGDDWTVRGDNGPDVTIVQDPVDGSKGETLRVQYSNDNADWQNAQIKLTAGQNLLSIGPGKTITIDVWTDHTGDPNIGTYTGMLKLEQGTIVGAKEFSFPVSGTGWETITIDTSVDKAGNAVEALEAGLLVLFVNYGNGAHKKDDLRYYDNITFTDGSVIQGDAIPQSAAPAPSHDSADVLNIFSDAYSGSIDWNDNELRAGWSSGDINIYDLDGTGADKMLKLKGTNYIGQYWTNGTSPKGAIDLSTYEFMSVDVWTPELTADATLGVALLNAGEVKIDHIIPAGPAGWRTITMNVSDYAASELTVTNGVKWEPNPQGSIPLMYIDNFFAWNTPSPNTILNVSINANGNTKYPNVESGEVLALFYSLGNGSVGISSPFSDSDNDGIWNGSLTLPKDSGEISFKVIVTDAASGYTQISAASGDAITGSDFSYQAGANTVIADLFLLDRDTTTNWATTAANAVVDVNFTIRGYHPDHTAGQYGIRNVDTSCYNITAITTNTDGVFTGTMSIPFYSTKTFEVGFHNGTNGWCGDNMVSKNANTNTDFSVSVVESTIDVDLTAIEVVDSNDNFLVYTSVGDQGNYPPATINFSEDWIANAIKGDEGAVATIIDDPSNSDKGKVLNVVYDEQSQDWQNAQIDIIPGQQKVDLRTNKTVSFDVWTSHDDTDPNKGKYSGLLKLEITPQKTVEKGFVTSGNGWETITVDFSENFKNDNGDAGSNDQFTKIVLFTNYGGGDGAHQVSDGVHKKSDTRIYDNFTYAEGDVVPSPIPPLTSYSENFDNGDSAWGAADQASFIEANGYGTASSTNATNYAHIFYNTAAPLDLSAQDKGFSVKVKGPRASKVFLKLQIGDEWWNNHEWPAAEANYTTPGEWQTITFDATAVNSSTMTRIVIFFDIETPASADPNDDIFQIDDFKFDVLATLGLNDISASNEVIAVYPNPTNGIINISGVDKVDAIKVFSISGQLVKETVNTNIIDLSSERDGLYLIEIQHEGKTSVNKLIVR
jgi:hypothetical protein